MFLLVRDEDVPTVAETITGFAFDEGLEITPPPAAMNPLAMLAALTKPRAIVAQTGDSVLVSGAASFDIAEPEEWAARLSKDLGTEVVALDVADDGVRVYVYSDGEEESLVEVPLSPSGTTRSPELADLVDDEDAARALEGGVSAGSPDELAEALLRCLGAGEPSGEPMTLEFEEPADDTPAFEVEAIAGVTLMGTVGGPVTSAVDYAFGVSVRGVSAVEGMRFEIGGDALALLEVDGIDVSVRTRDVAERLPRTLEPERAGDAIAVTVADAYLESVAMGLDAIDMSDMFSTVQRLMSGAEDQQRNTLLVGVSARALKRGAGELVLTVSSPSGEAAAASGSVTVRVG